jgi:putative membrane protein
MSVRSYSGPLVGRGPMRRANLAFLPWLLAAVTVLLQIAFPLTKGDTRTTLTIVTVVVFFLASASHAWIHRGLAWTGGYLLITVGGGLLVEAVGHRTGWPFGEYDYTGTLGAELFGVPLIVPLAWAMMAYPALIVARRLTQRWWSTTLVGALALASWDLFLDPMMVAEGHWVWDLQGNGIAGTTFRGLDGIPVQNFMGWAGTAMVMMALLALLPDVPTDDRQPIALWLWVYLSSVLANAVFLDRPSVALIGGVVMGLVAVPLMVVLVRDRP